MIKAVLMDMDGVMYDTEHLSTVVWTKVSREYDRPLSEEQILSFRGANKEDNCKRFLQWYPEDEELYWEMRKERYKLFFQYIDEHGVPIKPGLMRLLQTLQEYNIPVCIATGTARETAEQYWDKTGVRPYITASVCGKEVSRSKPNPEVFLLAANKLETPPEQCLVLEDSPNGIRAAYNAGCYVIMVPDETEPDAELLPLVNEVLPDLNAVADRIPDLI